jgi:tRNA-Thr(GGU) m(6)t(6)A37 methyltransferase TsaA
MTIEPIGRVCTAVLDKYQASRQPNSIHDRHLRTTTAQQKTMDYIELFPHHNFEQALSDLDRFERIWVLFTFHRNHHWKPKVQIPRSRTKKGVFATRSPHRPNALGMSVVELVSIHGRRLYIGEHDMLAETPVLDIKPYIPLYDSFPTSKAGWFDTLSLDVLSEPLPVGMTPEAHRQVAWLEEHGIVFMAHIIPILQSDPMPHSYRRIALHPHGYVIAWKSWRITYRIDVHSTPIDTAKEQQQIMIVGVESGYTREAVQEAQKNNALHSLHQGEAHWEFYQRWSG